MSFQEKNTAISLLNFLLILGFYLLSLFQLAQGGNLNLEHVFRVWGVVAVLAIIGTIAVTILTHIGSGLLHRIKTREKLQLNAVQDERDQLIDLRGTSVAYRLSSIGVALAMLTLVFGQPPLVLFSLLIFFGLLAQIAADSVRLYLYRRDRADD